MQPLSDPFGHDGRYEFFGASFDKLNGFYSLLEQRAEDLHRMAEETEDVNEAALSQITQEFQLLADKPKKWIYSLDPIRKTFSLEQLAKPKQYNNAYHAKKLRTFRDCLTFII
ncbi:MAG: hypothetical protein Q9224_006803, partial [Gallowayella concinna]